MLNDPVLDKKRRRRRVDGRTLRGILRALEAAEADEHKDAELLRKWNSGTYNYSTLGEELGLSRQRATKLVHRAMMRRLILQEYRAGRELTDISRTFHNMYPRRGGLRGSKARQEEEAANADTGRQ